MLPDQRDIPQDGQVLIRTELQRSPRPRARRLPVLPHAKPATVQISPADW